VHRSPQDHRCPEGWRCHFVNLLALRSRAQRPAGIHGAGWGLLPQHRQLRLEPTVAPAVWP